MVTEIYSILRTANLPSGDQKGVLRVFLALRWEYCAEADSGEETIRAVAEFKPDLVIMEVSRPGMRGVQATKIIHETFPAIGILLLTLHKSTELLRVAFSAAAIAYVLKSDAEGDLINALETAARGEIYVTHAILPTVTANILREIKQSRASAIDAGPEARVAKA